MRFTPVTPARLAGDLADWAERLPPQRPRVVIDGFAEAGATELADAVAAQLIDRGRPVVRLSTSWWWRSASLRLEFGRTDLDMLLGGWLDTPALRREVLDPLADGGSGRFLGRLRDPDTDRSIRATQQSAPPHAVVVVDSPFAAAWGVRGDGLVHLQVSPATAARRLPDEYQWWVEGYRRYLEEDRPAEAADVIVAYDHPASPALACPTRR